MKHLIVLMENPAASPEQAAEFKALLEERLGDGVTVTILVGARQALVLED
jgi:hypothetical protein